MSVFSTDSLTWAIGPPSLVPSWPVEQRYNLLNLHDPDPPLWVNEWKLTVNSPPPSPIAAEGSLTPNLRALGVLDDVPLLRLPPSSSPEVPQAPPPVAAPQSLALIRDAEDRLSKAEYTLQVYKTRLALGTFHRVKTYKEKLLKRLELDVINARRELIKVSR